MKNAVRDIFLSAAVLLLLASTSSATPMVSGTFAFTENFGPNSPVGFTPGHVFQLGATVSDPLGVPSNIASVSAKLLPSGPSTLLPYLDIGVIFSGLYNSVTPYAGETGQWEIRATNNQGEISIANTGVLNDPLLMPLATNLAASGQSLMPLITWDPVLFDDDSDSETLDVEADFYRIRLLDSASDQFFRSDPIFSNSFQVPTGLINPGVTFIRLEAVDLDNGVQQNRSSTFTQFVAAAVPAPSPMILLSGGLAVLLSFRRRQRRL